jgi:hypothetical protein
MKLFGGIDKLDQEFPEAEIEEIHRQASRQVQEALDRFFQKCKEEETESWIRRWEDAKQMIEHVDQRIHYWETRRTQFLQLATGILAASLAAIIAILPRLYDANLCTVQSIPFCAVFVASLVLTFGCIVLLTIWNRQNNPSYPFTKGYRIWRWHYRHAEKTPLDTNVFGYDRETYREQARIFAENLSNYKVRTLESEPRELLDQDLSQLFLLLTNEKFKIKFVSQLRNCLWTTLRLAFWAFVLVLAGAYVLLMILQR